MSMYHTRIYLVGPLIFEKNKAGFGGAIYIAEIEGYILIDRYCTTLEQITFSSNFAGTLGNDVYIEKGFETSWIPFRALIKPKPII